MRFRWPAGLVLLLLLAGCVARNNSAGCVVLPADSLLREGDLVFRRGRGVASGVVLAADGGVYSHVGVVVKGDDGWSVVHITPGEDEPERIKAESLDVFFSPQRAVKGAVMRMPESGEGNEGNEGNEGREAAKTAKEMVKRDILFDHAYDLTDTVKMYCTELVWHIFDFGEFSGGVYILPGDLQKHAILIYEF